MCTAQLQWLLELESTCCPIIHVFLSRFSKVWIRGNELAAGQPNSTTLALWGFVRSPQQACFIPAAARTSSPRVVKACVAGRAFSTCGVVSKEHVPSSLCALLALLDGVEVQSATASPIRAPTWWSTYERPEV